MVVKALREGLGRVIVFFDWLTPTKSVKRSKELQRQVLDDAKSLSLYQFYACPFCVKVRRKMRALNIPIEICDAQNNQDTRAELAREGGKLKVPCLRIEEQGSVRWMYESSEIIRFLDQRYSRL